MNLLEIMRKEILELQLIDKVDIKDHIYRRTGELFEYDPLWSFAFDKRENLRQKRVDITNVTDFYLTCYSWSYLFRDLLHAFNIPAVVMIKDDHAHVESYINGERYFSDLMLNFEDIKRIKFGMKSLHNFRLTNNRILPDSNDVAESEDSTLFNTEDMLEQFRQRLDILRQKMNYNYYVYQVFKLTEIFINDFFSKPNIGYVSGLKFICHLLQTFISEKYIPYNTHFFDVESGIYKEVYSVPLDGEIRYFAYEQNEDKIYKLHEVSKEVVDSFTNHYFSMRSYNLTLQEKPNSGSKITRPVFMEKDEYSKSKKK